MGGGRRVVVVIERVARDLPNRAERLDRGHGAVVGARLRGQGIGLGRHAGVAGVTARAGGEREQDEQAGRDRARQGCVPEWLLR
jgi:hypothetical protein